MKKQFDEHTVLRTVDDMCITPFSAGFYIISSRNINLYEKINAQTYELLQLFDGNKSIREVICDYRKTNTLSANLQEDDYYCIINKLAYLGVFANFTIEKKNFHPSYILLRKQLFSSSVVNKVSKRLDILFNKYFVLSIIVGSIFICGFFTLFATNSIEEIKQELFWVIPVLFLVSSVVHEFGHSASALHYGAINGEIGMGLYYFQFVLYSNITDVWRLPKKQRVVVDISGIYFELLFSAIILMFGLIFTSSVCIVSSIAIVCSCLFNLNPFLRTDGFWIFCDLIDEPNVFRHAGVYIKNIKGWLSGGIENIRLSKILVACYGLMCYFFTGAFVIHMIINNLDDVIMFIPNIIDFIVKIIETNSINIRYSYKFMQPAIFYLLIFNWSKGLLLKIK